MAKWNKVILSGSQAELAGLTGSAVSPLRFPNITGNASKTVLVFDESTKQVYKSDYLVGASTPSLTLPNNQIYVGDGTGNADGLYVSGDATLVSGSGGNVGAMLTLSGSAIANKTTLSTVAGTEYVLVLDGVDLKKTLASNIGSRTGSFTGSFTGSINQPLADGNIFVGSGTGRAAAVVMSGDVTIVANGTTTIGPQKVHASMLEASIVNNLTTHDSNTLNLTQTQFLVSSGSAFLNRKLTYNQLLNDIRPRLSTGSFTGSLNGELTSVFLTSNNIWTGDINNRAVITPVNGDISYSNMSGLFIFKSNYLSSVNNAWHDNGSPLPPANGNELQFFIGSGSGLTNSPFTYNQLTGSLSASFAGSGLFNGGGNFVSGPASSVNNEIAIYNSTTGKIIKQSGAYVSGTGAISGSTIETSQGATIGGALVVNGNTTLGDAGADTVTVNGVTTFNGLGVTTSLLGSGSVGGDLSVGGKLTVTGNTAITGNATITGDLFVNGTLTQINTDNLQVEDRFVLLASGSVGAGDAGLIFQQSSTTGIMYGYDASESGGGAYGRFAVKPAAGNVDNGFTSTPDIYIPTVESGASAPSSNPTFGGTLGKGSIFIKDDGEIWIYS